MSSGEVAKLHVSVTAKTDEFNAGMTGVQGKLKTIGTSMTNFGGTMTKFITLPVAAAGVAMLKSATDLEATEAKFNTVFAGMTDDATAFIDEFKKLTPLTTTEARGVASGIQDLLVPMGFLREDATKLTGEFMPLIGALANFNNATHTAAEVANAVSSALVGEYEPMRRLGVVTSKTAIDQQVLNMGLADTSDGITDQMRVLALHEIITESSADAIAAYTEANLDAKTKLGLLKTEVIDTAAELMYQFLPAINEVIGTVRGLVQQFKNLSPEQQTQIIRWIGITAAAFPLIMIFGKISTGLSAMIGLFKTASVAMSGMAATKAVATTATLGYSSAMGAVGAAATTATISIGALATGVGLFAVVLGGTLWALNHFTDNAGEKVTNMQEVLSNNMDMSKQSIRLMVDEVGTIPSAWDSASSSIGGILTEMTGDAKTNMSELRTAFVDEMGLMLDEQYAVIDSRRQTALASLAKSLELGLISPEFYVTELERINTYYDDMKTTTDEGYEKVNKAVEDALKEQGSLSDAQRQQILSDLKASFSDTEREERANYLRQKDMEGKFVREQEGTWKEHRANMITELVDYNAGELATISASADERNKLIAQMWLDGTIATKEQLDEMQKASDDYYAADVAALVEHNTLLYLANQEHYKAQGLIYDASIGEWRTRKKNDAAIDREYAKTYGKEELEAFADGLSDQEIMDRFGIAGGHAGDLWGAGITTALEAAVSKAKAIIASIPGYDPNWSNLNPGGHWGDMFHSGGTFRAPRLGGEGMALLKDGERVTPAGVPTGEGGATTINMTITQHITDKATADYATDKIGRVLQGRGLVGAYR